LQAVIYAVSAAVSAFFFATWKRLDDDLKSRVWRRYGWFSALAFVGSVGGLVTAAADIRYRYNFQRTAKFYESGDPCSNIQDIFDILDCYANAAVIVTQTNYWLAVSPVPYAIEFLCLCCAKLLVRAHSFLRSQSRRPYRDQVVERMVEFVVKGQEFLGRWANLLPRIAVVSVTVLNAVNIVFMAVFSYYASKGWLQLCFHPFRVNVSSGSSFWSKLAATLANPALDVLGPCILDKYAPSCIIGIYVRTATDALSDGFKFAGYGSICEGCSLVIMLVSFLAGGVLCIRRFYSGVTSSATEAGRQIKKVRLQITVTVSTVFVLFLVRSVYAAALAASRRGQISTPFDDNPQCARTTTVFCDTCQEVGLIVQTWLWLCPEFSFTVFLLSSPVTILVSLWGMTTESHLQSLRWGHASQASLRDNLKSFIKAGESPMVPK
jgi:hypothetical protein